ncbi:MAG: N-acetyltransferase [Clostridiaceae bacterium]|nr:N-acetyltransferase [Clostridiaceae bacterium]
MNIRFEPFTDKYLDEAREIYNYYIKNTTVTFHTEEISVEEMKYILYQDDDIYVTLAILDNDEFCGYAYIGPYKKRQAYRISGEVTLYLKPGYSGKGIGSIVLETLDAHARKNGIHSLIAVICGENTASIKLFAKNGYEQCGYLKEIGIKFGRMLDVVIMQKILK